MATHSHILAWRISPDRGAWWATLHRITKSQTRLNTHNISWFSSFSWPSWGFPGGSDGKASVYNAEDPGSIPGSGRSNRERNGKPAQYSCLGNPIDRGAWQATVHRVAKSGTRLKRFSVSLLLLFDLLGKNSYGREKWFMPHTCSMILNALKECRVWNYLNLLAM